MSSKTEAQHDMPRIGCVNHDCDKCKSNLRYEDLYKQVCEQLDATSRELSEVLAEQPAYREAKTFHEGKPVYVAEQQSCIKENNHG